MFLKFIYVKYYEAQSDRLSMWLSVDPPADKYPGLSPYAYCANNPVRYIDPDGQMIGGSLKVMIVRGDKVSNTVGMVRTPKNAKGEIVPKAHQGINTKAICMGISLKKHGFRGNVFLIDMGNNRVTFYNDKGICMNI